MEGGKEEAKLCPRMLQALVHPVTRPRRDCQSLPAVVIQEVKLIRPLQIWRYLGVLGCV